MESQVGPPGYDPEMGVKPKSKSVRRKERKKEKRHQTTVERAKNSEHTVDEDMEETVYAQNSGPESEPLESVASRISQLSLSKATTTGRSSNSIEDSGTANAGVGIDKKIRALKKKMLCFKMLNDWKEKRANTFSKTLILTNIF